MQEKEICGNGRLGLYAASTKLAAQGQLSIFNFFHNQDPQPRQNIQHQE